MNTVAWISNARTAWNRFLRFIILLEESMDKDFITPLYRRVDALERQNEELRRRLACTIAANAEKAAS